MSNTSATGGYLPQTSAVQPESQSLMRFLQSVIVGITALPAAMVRPSWQQNPPPIPDINTNWCGFGITRRVADNSAYHKQLDDGAGHESADIIRHETLDILCSFYGTDAENYAGQLRDGFEIGQNREQLFLVNMGFVSGGEIIHTPELVNDRFFNRADVIITLRREIRRNYPILSFVAASGDIYTDLTTLPVVHWQA